MRNTLNVKKEKKGIILFFFFVFVCVGIWFFFIGANTNAPIVKKIVTKNTIELPDVVIPTKIQTVKIEKSAFPVTGREFLNWVEATGEYPANTPFAKSAEIQVKDFVNDFVGGYTEDEILKDETSNINASASVSVTQGKKLFSYLYFYYEYTQGAHGSASVSSEAFDMNGKEYLLEDLFLPDSKYLSIISQMAIKHFKADSDFSINLEDPMFIGGLKPLTENFSTFFISGNTIVFQFQQYQIGPYSSGMPTFMVSVADPEIRNIIRPELFGLE